MLRVYASVVLVTMTLFFADVAPFGCCGGGGNKPSSQQSQGQPPR